MLHHAAAGVDAGGVVHAGEEGERQEGGKVIEFAGREGNEDRGADDESVGDVVFEAFVVGFAALCGGGLVGHFGGSLLVWVGVGL